MKLSISKILSKEDVADLVKGKVESMSALVSIYRKIPQEKIDIITSHQTTFIDVITDAISSEWEYFNSTKLKPDELRLAIERVFLDKIRVGLMAMNQIPLTQVLSKFLLMDSNFASVKFIEHVCSVNSHSVLMKSSSDGTTLHMVREKKNSAAPSRASTSSRAEDQLKYLFKNRPDIVKALGKDFVWKNILHVHHFWCKIPKYENEYTLVNWLMSMAKAKSVDTFPMYKRRMALILLLRIMDYVAIRRRSISHIVDHLCLEKQGLVDVTFVHEVINSYPEKVKITEDTQSLPISKRIVKAVSNTTFEPENTNPMSLPGKMDSKVIPLLTLRITFINIHNASKHVLTDRKAKDLVLQHGCFFRYLTTLAEIRKPKLAEDFQGHLQGMIKTFLNRILKACYPRPRSVAQIIEEIGGLQGLIDDKFITDAVSTYSLDFAFVDSGEVALREVVTHEMDPHKHLESTAIFALLYDRPSFARILDAFNSLPEIAKSMLAENSMSFFEWLITLAKRDMQDDYPAIESHLHNQVRKQVHDIHSQNHCQMTLHHVHKRICKGFPMLLSPNFLNWCLNRKESPFYVDQSWIYIKRYNNTESRDQETNVKDTNEQAKFDESVAHVIQQIRVASGIDVVLGLLKNIPRDLALKALSKDTFWYDFLENNMKERNDRLKLASLVVEEAKKCVRHRIMRTSELAESISNGLSNFISADVLALVLQQNHAGFAMSDSRSGDSMVGIVRGMENGDIAFFDEQDKVFVEKVLSCFPSNDSSDIPTLANIIQKEINNATTPTSVVTLSNDFMKCYFLMFPMLFCVQDFSVILTCLALERKKAQLKTLESPPSSGENERKRKSGRSKGSRHKKKRKVKVPSKERKGTGSDKSENIAKSREGIVSSEKQVGGQSSDDSSENGATVVGDSPTANKDTGNLSVKTLIEALPEPLITDFAMNVLLQNGNAVKPQKMIEELIQVALIPSEVARVRESSSAMKLFTEKAFHILKTNKSTFVLVCDAEEDPCFENVKVIKAKMSEKSPSADLCALRPNQTKETSNIGKDANPSYKDANSSESHVVKHNSPVLIQDDESEENSAADNESTTNNGVIECFDVPFNACTSKDLIPKETTVKDKSAGLSTNSKLLPKMPSAPLQNADSLFNVSSAFDASDIPKGSGGHHGIVNDSGRNERDEQLRLFCNQFLKISSGTCSTDLLLEDCYHHFKTERFARSRLAFQGYLYDFLLRNLKSYVLGGLQSQFGVSWITYCNWSSPAFDTAKPKNLSFLSLIPEVVKICYSFMRESTKFEASLTDLCATTESSIRNQLDDYPDAEIFQVVRCLVLVTFIRNLRLFCFSVNTPTVYLRKRGHGTRVDRRHLVAANKEIEAVLLNRTLAEAVLHMAEIVQVRGPSSAGVLRRIWMARAPPKLCNVFGTGISFTLSLRKYSSLFNSTSDGMVSVNEETLKYLKSRLQNPH